MATIFVGDVHGCAEELRRLLRTIPYRPHHDRLLLTGDAFARGPDPAGVWESIRQTRAEMVLGNHDDRLLEQLRRYHAGLTPTFHHEHQRRTFQALLPHAGPLRTWLEIRPLYLREPGFLLVHAGIDPQAGLAGTRRDQFLTLRLWPPAPGIRGPRWHEYYPPTGELLIFGHDAPNGLVERRDEHGRLYLLGLDSGCVYGGSLSAYVLEQDRLVQIPCLQAGGYWRR